MWKSLKPQNLEPKYLSSVILWHSLKNWTTKEIVKIDVFTFVPYCFFCWCNRVEIYDWPSFNIRFLTFSHKEKKVIRNSWPELTSSGKYNNEEVIKMIHFICNDYHDFKLWNRALKQIQHDWIVCYTYEQK